MKTHSFVNYVQRAPMLTAITLIVLATIASATYADTLEFEFHGKDTSAAASGNLDATFKITGEKSGTNISVSAMEIVVIDGAPSATNLFAALRMYGLKPGGDKVSFPVSGVSLRPITVTLTNGRDTKLPGNDWKLNIDGKSASLRTHGDAMDVSFKGTLAPKVQAAAVEGAKTTYIIGAIVTAATLGAGIYLLDNYRRQRERRRKRRRSLLVNDPQDKADNG